MVNVWAGAAPRDDAVKTTVIVQAAPAFSVPVQVPPAREKSGDEKTGSIPIAAEVPVFCSVSVCAALALPTDPVKVRDVGVTLSTATAGTEPNSTAPGSKWVSAGDVGSGLSLPKKSVLGTRL
jgi:hypothetical protein